MTQRDLSTGPNEFAADVFFVGTLSSHSWPGVLATLWMMGMFAPLYLFKGAWLFLPYSLPVTGLLGWSSFCLLTNRKWNVTVSPRYITWDHTFFGPPHFVHVADIQRVLVNMGEPGHEIHLYLSGGNRVRISPSITAWIDQKALIAAIRQAADTVDVEYVS